MPRAWSFLSLIDRQHGGNLGYQDHTALYYSYDSTVANSAKVLVGDLAVLRDSLSLLGMGWIDSITEKETTKNRLRCPFCTTTDFKARKLMSPTYRCVAKHQFEEPTVERIPVLEYRAFYNSTWRRLNGLLTVGQLEAMTLGKARQHSIRQMDLDKIRIALSGHLDDGWLTESPC